MLYDMSLSSVFLAPGVAVGAAAAANVRASPTWDCGDSRREPDAPVPGVVDPIGTPAVVLTVRALTRFGSVQSKFAFTLTCGSAWARTWMITPLVRLISCSALRRVGLRCSDVRIA